MSIYHAFMNFSPMLALQRSIPKSIMTTMMIGLRNLSHRASVRGNCVTGDNVTMTPDGGIPISILGNSRGRHDQFRAGRSGQKTIAERNDVKL